MIACCVPFLLHALHGTLLSLSPRVFGLASSAFATTTPPTLLIVFFLPRAELLCVWAVLLVVRSAKRATAVDEPCLTGYFAPSGGSIAVVVCHLFIQVPVIKGVITHVAQVPVAIYASAATYLAKCIQVTRACDACDVPTLKLRNNGKLLLPSQLVLPIGQHSPEKFTVTAPYTFHLLCALRRLLHPFFAQLVCCVVVVCCFATELGALFKEVSRRFTLHVGATAAVARRGETDFQPQSSVV